VDVLPLQIVDQGAAVVEIFQLHAVPVEPVGHNVTAQLTQIAGDDQIVVGGLAARVLKMGRERGIGGGRHSGAHIGRVLDALVHHFAGGDVGDIGPRSLVGQNDAARPSHCPLGGRSALAPIFQGGAVLPLGGAEVGGGHGCDLCAIPPVQQHGSQGQALRHGGAGPVQPEEGHILSSDGKAGADTLVEQISCQQVIQTGYTEAGLAERGG